MNYDRRNSDVDKQIAVLFRAIEGRKALIGQDYTAGLYGILIAIAHGYYFDPKFDVISLAAWGNLPRTTCQRDLGRLIDLGLVERKKDGRRYLLVPTDHAIQKIEVYLDLVFSEMNEVGLQSTV